MGILDEIQSLTLRQPTDQELIEWDFTVKDCELRLGHCNEWEENFIKNMRKRLNTGQILTKPMLEKLENIWERVTDIQPFIHNKP